MAISSVMNVLMAPRWSAPLARTAFISGDAAAVFIAPYFFLSALGGELADRYDKAKVAQRLKLSEIGIALIAVVGFGLHSVPLLFFALFLFGVILCEFFVIPKAVEALLWFNEWLNLEPDFRLNEWLGFAIFMPLVFGLSFQTPLVMLFLERIGLVTVEKFRTFRRYAWFILCVFAALIIPTFDIPTMLMLWLPMCLLYELGIWMCVLSPKRPAFDDDDVPKSEELIEV